MPTANKIETPISIGSANCQQNWQLLKRQLQLAVETANRNWRQFWSQPRLSESSLVQGRDLCRRTLCTKPCATFAQKRQKLLWRCAKASRQHDFDLNPIFAQKMKNSPKFLGPGNLFFLYLKTFFSLEVKFAASEKKRKF